MPRFSLPARLATALAFTAALCACTDAPLLPRSLVKTAGGMTWVAVAEPRGLPDVGSWLPYLAPADAARAHGLLEAADAARHGGTLELAQDLDTQARLFSAGALAADPPPARLHAAAAALEEWQARATERLAQGDFPQLAEALRRVSAASTAAQEAQARGEPRAAAVQLAQGGEAARAFAPTVVALRLVEQAERRVDQDAAPTPDLKRARLLLHLAREAMARGDQTRALRRAWYALQLIDAEDARRAAEPLSPGG